MNHSNIMIDLECLSLQADAVILSIGAVRFDPSGEDDWTTLDYPSRMFYTALPMNVQIEIFNGHVDDDTLCWWMRQSKEAQHVFEESATMHKHSMNDALYKLIDFMGQCDGLWASPAHFDYPKLLWLSSKLGLTLPCEYWQVHCAMTLKHLADPTGKKTKIETLPGFIGHNALEDAKKQVLQVQQCLRLLKS